MDGTPDEVLAAIERRDLSEGHGRALLLAADHGDRRRLARDAIEHGWSVRELEDRARRANSTAGRAPRARARKPALHPDQETAVLEIGDSFGAALGRDVEVTASAAGGYRVHLSFESAGEALELARRLRG